MEDFIADIDNEIAEFSSHPPLSVALVATRLKEIAALDDSTLWKSRRKWLFSKILTFAMGIAQRKLVIICNVFYVDYGWFAFHLFLLCDKPAVYGSYIVSLSHPTERIFRPKCRRKKVRSAS